MFSSNMSGFFYCLVLLIVKVCFKTVMGTLSSVCVCVARSRELHRSLKSAAWLPVVTSGRCWAQRLLDLRKVLVAFCRGPCSCTDIHTY